MAIIGALGMAALMQGCKKNAFYENTKSIPNAVWLYGDTLAFPFAIDDTSKLYHLSLDFTHQVPFSTQNIYVKLHTQFPDGKKLSKVKAVDFYDNAGKSLGTCSGDHCTTHLVLQENMYFKQPGAYVISVEQFMRQDSLAGVEQVKMILEKAQ